MHFEPYDPVPSIKGSEAARIFNLAGLPVPRLAPDQDYQMRFESAEERDRIQKRHEDLKRQIVAQAMIGTLPTEDQQVQMKALAVLSAVPVRRGRRAK